jgi:hypothetical protein
MKRIALSQDCLSGTDLSSKAFDWITLLQIEDLV